MQEDHNPGSSPQCDDIKAVKIELKELRERVENIEYAQKDQAEELKDIKEFQGGTKVYVAEIKEQLSKLEDRLFTFMNGLVESLTKKEETVASAEAEAEAAKAKTAADLAALQTKAETNKWDKALTTIKDIIKILVPAVIGYLAAKGGK